MTKKTLGFLLYRQRRRISFLQPAASFSLSHHNPVDPFFNLQPPSPFSSNFRLEETQEPTSKFHNQISRQISPTITKFLARHRSSALRRRRDAGRRWRWRSLEQLVAGATGRRCRWGRRSNWSPVQVRSPEQQVERWRRLIGGYCGHLALKTQYAHQKVRYSWLLKNNVSHWMEKQFWKALMGYPNRLIDLLASWEANKSIRRFRTHIQARSKYTLTYLIIYVCIYIYI